MQPEHVRERGVDDIHRSEVDRPDEHAGEQGREQEQERGRKTQACPRQTHQRLRFSTFPIVRTKSTMRGPHRDATESSTPTTDPVRTAAIPLQPGRFATDAAVAPQQRVSARTMTSGFAETMYSADSFGYPVPAESAASAMFRSPN